jgi:hypothetical protein
LPPGFIIFFLIIQRAEPGAARLGESSKQSEDDSAAPDIIIPENKPKTPKPPTISTGVTGCIPYLLLFKFLNINL